MENDNKTFLELLKEIKKFNKIDLIAQAFQTKYAKETAGEDDDRRKKDADKSNELLGEILTTLKDTKEEEKSEAITGATSPNILNTPEEILAHESKKQTIIFKDLFEISEKSLEELKKISFAITGDKTPSSLLSKRSAAGAETGDGVGGAGGKGSFLGSLLGGAAGGGAAVLGTKALGAGKAAGAGAGAAKAGGLIGGVKGAMAGGGGAALGTAALIAAPFAANAVAKQFGVGGEASYLDPFKGIDNKQAEENFKKMSFMEQLETTVAAGIETVGSAVAPNIANEARAGRIKRQTKYLALTEGERELKKKDPKTFAKYEEFTRVRTKEYSYDLAKSQGRQTPNDEDIKAAESKAKGEASQRFSQEIEAAGIKPSKIKPAPVTKKSEVVPPKDVPGSSVKEAVTGAPAKEKSSSAPSASLPGKPSNTDPTGMGDDKDYIPVDTRSLRQGQQGLKAQTEQFTKDTKPGSGYKEEPAAPKKTIGEKIGGLFGFGDKKQEPTLKEKAASAAARADSAAFMAGGRETAPDGSASPEMRTYMQAEQESRIADDQLRKQQDEAARSGKMGLKAQHEQLMKDTKPGSGYQEEPVAPKKTIGQKIASFFGFGDKKESEATPVQTPIEERQAGGPVTEGKPYLVGETGPEVIVPKENSTVVPKNKKAAKSVPQLVETIDMGKGRKKEIMDDGSYTISDAEGVTKFNAKGTAISKTVSGFGFRKEEDLISGDVKESYSQGPLRASQKRNKAGEVVEESASYDFGLAKVSSSREAGGEMKTSTEIRGGSEENAAMKDQMAAGKNQSTPIVMNNVSNNNQTTYVPVKGEPRPGSRGSALDRYSDRVAAY